MRKDMTKAQFDAACQRHGFRPQGCMGYYSLPDCVALVSVWNAGPNNRARLAYLIRKHKEILERQEAKAAKESAPA